MAFESDMAVDIFWFNIDILTSLMAKPRKGQKVQPESQEEEVEDVEEDVEEDDESLEPQVPGEEEQEMQQRIIEDILDRAAKASDSQKLTWNAIYALKSKEMELSSKLNQEIEKIKEKYELLKQPIYHKISAAALGQKLEAELYEPEGIPKTIDLKKVTPQKIEDFWGIILDKEGLLTEQVDVDCIKKTNFFQCELLDHNTNHMRITFKFSEQTDYFKNLKLSVESKYDSEKNQPIRTIQQELKYKKDKVQHSLFTLLFDSTTDINQFYNVACEIYQDYANALYFYFRQEENQDQAIEEGEEENQDDDQVEEVQPKKKVKQNPPAEKPECKNQ